MAIYPPDWPSPDAAIARDAQPARPACSTADLCFCNSGRAINDCCYARCDTRPKAPTTGYAHPKCYARALNDCCETISGEHYVSESVLKILGEHVKVTVAPFLKDQPLELPIAKLKANMLCRRHNSALSPLDDVAMKFFHVMLRVTEQRHQVLRGSELERWGLKVATGLLAAGLGDGPSGRIPQRDPSLATLQVLFGNDDVGPDGGLVITTARRTDKESMSLAILGSNAEALGFRFAYLHLLFFDRHRGETIAGIRSNEVKYFERPSALTIVFSDGDYREVHFGPSGPYVRINVTDQWESRVADGARP